MLSSPLGRINSDCCDIQVLLLQWLSLFQGEPIDGEVYFGLRCTLECNVSHWHLHLGFASVDVISLFLFFCGQRAIW